MKLKKYLFVLIVIVFIIAYVYVKPYNEYSFPNETIKDEYYSLWDDFYDRNNDYIGHIVFDSNIINLPVVQSYDNDYYLRRSFGKEYDIKGTPFIDYRCSLNDQNIIIYGHYIRKGSKEMFTPLEKLIDNRDNDYVELKLRSSIRRYELISIIIVDGEFENEHPFLLQNLNADSIDKLNEFIKTDALYYSEYKIDCTDALLTLITCTNSLNDDREIVIFKEIDK